MVRELRIEEGTFNRRAFLKLTIGVLVASLFRPPAAQAEQSEADVCYWEKRDETFCRDGTLYEYWCFVCCVGVTCETQSCEWKAAGSC